MSSDENRRGRSRSSRLVPARIWARVKSRLESVDQLYQALPQADSFRLITVHQARADPARIDCDLETFSFNAAPDYAALSYSWGSESLDHYVKVNGVNASVSKSCYDALIAFRDQWFTAQIVPQTYSGTSKFQSFREAAICRLWVDQLCISQQDYEERSAQILVMRDIYTMAAAVWIWGEDLTAKYRKGDPLPGANDRCAEQRISDLIEHLVAASSGKIRWLESSKASQLDTNYANLASWHSILVLMSQRYFTRRWILQEVSANENTLLLLKGRLLLLRALDHASLYTVEMGFTEFIKAQHPEQFPDFDDARRNLVRTGMPLRAIRSIRPWNPDYKPKPYSYLYLLLRLSATQVSRHEDIFYALRPLATKELLLPEPVYGETNVELHKMHAAAFVRMGWAAAILQSAGIAWSQTQELPSWCPNFGRKTARMTLNSSISQWTLLTIGPAPQALLTPSQSMSSYFVISEPNLEVLKARVSLECSLEYLCEENSLANFPDYDTLQSYEWVSCVRSKIKTQTTEPLTRFIRDELTQLLDDDWRLNLGQQHAIDLSIFDLALRTLLAPIYPRVLEDETFRKRVDSQGIERVFSMTKRNYKLAVTNSGLLGFVPEMSRVDDHVVLFPGGWLPVILRKSHIQNTYQIIGDAFILNLRGKEYELQVMSAVVKWSEPDYMFFDLKDEELTKITLV